MAKATKKKIQYWGTGRRKTAVARVRLLPGGNGEIVVNGKSIDEYITNEIEKQVICQPLAITDTQGTYDIVVNVKGGGYTGQAGAIRHGIARALIVADESLRPTLKKAGFLTRDSRIKERKKYGLKKARRAPQFSKR